MNFEDIVDMEWVNSNTTSDETLPTSPNAIAVKDEPMDTFPSIEDTAALYDFPTQSMLWQHGFAAAAAAAAAAATAGLDLGGNDVASTLVDKPKDEKLPVDLVLPSTEHIKQLIEIAKRHLALREQGIMVGLDAIQHHPYERRATPAAAAVAAAAAAGTPPPSLFAPPPSTAVTVMPETVAPESLMKSTAAAAAGSTATHTERRSASPPPSSARRASSASIVSAAGNEDTMTLEAYAESDGIDIKKLTPKERRQLRNKISARNFRVRRKEYINTLEAQVDDHKKRADRLQSRLDDAEEENKQLRLEVDSLRCQNQQLLQLQQKCSSSSVGGGGSSSSPSSSTELVRTPSSPRVSSPIPKPNLNKDIGMLGSKASETYRQDTRILVSNAVMPVWDFDRIFTSQHQPKITAPPDPNVMQFAGYVLAGFVQLKRAATGSATIHDHDVATPLDLVLQHREEDDPANPIEAWHAPLLPDDRDFTWSEDMDKATATTPASDSVSPAYMEYLYDTLIMSALASNVSTDRSFWWWEPSLFH